MTRPFEGKRDYSAVHEQTDATNPTRKWKKIDAGKVRVVNRLLTSKVYDQEDRDNGVTDNAADLGISKDSMRSIALASPEMEDGEILDTLRTAGKAFQDSR